MRRSTPDAPPAQVPTGQVPTGQAAADAPTAGNTWLADLASVAAEIVAAILGCPPF